MPSWQEEAAEREARLIRERFGKRLRGEAIETPEMPMSELLRSIQEAAAKATEQFRDTACEGWTEKAIEIDSFGKIQPLACSRVVEESCPQKNASGCPRRIAEWQRRRRKMARATNFDVYLSYGIPGGVVRELFQGRVDESVQAVRIVEAWWKKRPRPSALLLLGVNDSGKTFAACHLLSRFGGRFVSAQQIADRARDEEYVHSLMLPSLVVIDEVGAEFGFADAPLAVARLLADRIEAGLWTIATGNIAADELRERYKDRLADRLVKLCQVEAVEYVGLRGLAPVVSLFD